MIFYFKNTKESFNYAFETMKRAKEMGSQVTRKAVCLFAALAINQNQPNLALEVLSMALQSNYITVRNLRLIALAQTGRFQDVFNGIMMIINSDLPSHENRGPILLETVSISNESILIIKILISNSLRRSNS